MQLILATAKVILARGDLVTRALVAQHTMVLEDLHIVVQAVPVILVQVDQNTADQEGVHTTDPEVLNIVAQAALPMTALEGRHILARVVHVIPDQEGHATQDPVELVKTVLQYVDE
jgi:hypothetical protein